MFRHLILSFFLSFFAVISMLVLYVFLPQYLSQRYGASKPPAAVERLLSVIPVPTPSPTPSPSPTPVPTPALTPVTLIIPKLNIQAAVEPVGLTPTDNMDVPKDAANVAWYMHGPAPSMEGNAVIAGHYDTPSGRPAIFYNLRTLEIGDEVEIVSINAVRSTYVVTEKASIPYDVFPSDFVFKTRSGKNLNLITCGGIWDARQKIYSNRIVIYTTLKE